MNLSMLYNNLSLPYVDEVKTSFDSFLNKVRKTLGSWFLKCIFYLLQYKKQYSSTEEYQRRLAVFADNVRLIERTNQEQSSYTR